MESVVRYIWPDNRISEGLVIFLIVLFVGWLVGIVLSWVRLRKRRDEIMYHTDVSMLADGIQRRFAEVAEAQPRDADPPGPYDSPADSAALSDSIFENFCQHNALPESSPICEHIRALFNAGWAESRIEIAELIRHTRSQLFRDNTVLRGILATFIVVGLLGTLFGLADSLALLSPPLVVGPLNNQNLEIASSVKSLLMRLNGAFGPSIWGVGLTILGVILFNSYLRAACLPLSTKLDRLTLTVWGPCLLPTIPLRLIQTLQHSERQMRDNFQAAYTVVGFARSIEKETANLGPNLAASNRELTSLIDSASGINDFAGKFVEGVLKLTSFQEEIRSLYQQMVSESKIFRASVQESVARSEVFQQGATECLQDQNRKLEEIVKALDSYEDAYVKERQQIDAKIQDVLDSARRAFDDLGTRNRELIEKVGGPIVDRLAEIEKTLSQELKDIQQRFGTFDAPIKDAAQKMENCAERISSEMRTLLTQLQQEFHKQREDNRGELVQLRTLYGELTAVLRNLSNNVEALPHAIRASQRGISHYGTHAPARSYGTNESSPGHSLEPRRTHQGSFGSDVVSPPPTQSWHQGLLRGLRNFLRFR